MKFCVRTSDGLTVDVLIRCIYFKILQFYLHYLFSFIFQHLRFILEFSELYKFACHCYRGLT